MKKIIWIILMLQIGSLAAQSIIGHYRNYFGNELKIKKDSTFYWSYQFDLASGWAVGNWTVSKDTLKLSPQPVYDTLVRKGKLDSLVYSLTLKPKRVNQNEYALNQITSGGQLIEYVPKKLLFKKERLYTFKKNGKLRRSKLRGILRKKKFVPWYFKK